MVKTLPVMLLKGFALLPFESVKLEVNNALSKKIVHFSEASYHHELVIVSPKNSLEENPAVDDLPLITVIAKITKHLTLEEGQERITVTGLKRVKISEYFNGNKNSDILSCHYLVPEIPKPNKEEEEAVLKEISRLLKQYVKLTPNMDNSILQVMDDVKSLEEITDKVASILPLNAEKLTRYIEEVNALKRAHYLIEDLLVELQIVKLDQKINDSLQNELDSSQKEFVLREKIKVIQQELGDDDKRNEEAIKYREKLDTLNLPSKTKEKIAHEISKYEYMAEMSPDLSFIRNYLDTFFSLPWNEESIEATDLDYITKSLNKTHYGLNNVKERILEYAAMKNRNPMLNSPIICLVGPPGIGKSTIASSIASALHRTFQKISVGGLNDSAELIGHRRTYLGSAPGRIIQSLQKCGTKNPVLLIDEVDKMVKDYKGDPASILLDVLDPNLNQTFTDSYLEEPFDLSHVFFLLTANYLEDIPPELRDRLEIIELSSYSIHEKIRLALDYLLPRIYLEYHVTIEEVKFTNDALMNIIMNYTNEAGVRDLQRKLETIFRKIIMEGAKKHKNLNDLITDKDIKKYLEEQISIEDLRPKMITNGLVNGLAVTSFGGSVMPIESILYDGSGKFIMTGLLGDVMKESLSVVESYLKSNAKVFEINENSFKKKDVHIHMLEASIPKNGPSAGVAITTSLISLYTNKIVNKDIAMTGEMTLRGEILPVGGIKEKIVSAFNEGIKTIFIPKANEVDLKKIPKEIRSELNIILVKDYMDIYKKIF